MNVPEDARRARVVLFGMRCAFTAPVLEALVDAPNVELCAIVLPERVESLPDPVMGPVLEIVHSRQVRLVGLAERSELSSSAFRQALESIAPDVIVVACFPWRLPEWLRALPSQGCLNVHPSLLPDGRGPDPLFWAFRWGVKETGVTLHLLDASFDTGRVLAQRRFTIPRHATLPSLERALAEMGAQLLLEQLPGLAEGTLRAVPQLEAPGRHARLPKPDDLVVPTSWSADHAARFIRAVTPVYGPIPVLIEATGQRLAVDEVIQVLAVPELSEPVLLRGSDARIQFSSGTLLCRLVAPSRPLALHRVRG